jgi:plastocyanin
MRAGTFAFCAALGLAGLGAGLAADVNAQARGVTIRGRVDLPHLPAPSERRPSAGDLGEGPAREVADRRRAVVYFETAPRGAFEDRDISRVAMDQRNETFVPHLLAVTVGTTVDFPNNDTTYHNVFSLSKARRFDLGRYATGRSKAVRFDRPGIVRVFCDIHSHMNAFILVFSHRYFAVADAEGRYEIDRVPPGNYTLVAWVEGAIRETRGVQVTAESRGVEVNFPLR